MRRPRHRSTVEPAPGHQFGLPDTRLGRRLRRHRRVIVDIASRRGIHNLRVFGSVARGEDVENSDVDLLVDLDDEIGIVGRRCRTRDGQRRRRGDPAGVAG